MNQVVMYGENEGNVFAWFMQKYFYENGSLKYLAEYSSAVGSEWTLKSVYDVTAKEWLGSIELDQRFDKRTYPAARPD